MRTCNASAIHALHMLLKNKKGNGSTIKWPPCSASANTKMFTIVVFAEVLDVGDLQGSENDSPHLHVNIMLPTSEEVRGSLMPQQRVHEPLKMM